MRSYVSRVPIRLSGVMGDKRGPPRRRRALHAKLFHPSPELARGGGQQNHGWSMNTQLPPGEVAEMKFGIGQPVPRNEDPTLVRGQGRYTDDLNVEGQAYAVMVRSPQAHGIIRGIDTDAARAMPGVLGIYTGADLAAAGYGAFGLAFPYTNRDGTKRHHPARYALSTDKVRFVGDPVAFVVAETMPQARDAAEAVVLDIEELPAVPTPEAADAPGAALVYDDVPGNLGLDFHFGDKEKTAAAFAQAAHVARLELTSNRVVVSAMEPRAAIGSYDGESGRFTLNVGSQGVFGLRGALAKDILKVPVDKLRIVTGNVGGSFGMKASPYPEYICLLHAARALGRPVKWTDLRSESFVSDQHGRATRFKAELALDGEGRFLALRMTGYGDLGSYLNQVGPLPQTTNIAKNAVGVYRTPLRWASTRSSSGARTTSAPTRSPTRRRSARATTRATSRPSSTTRSTPPTGPASRRARLRAARAESSGAGASASTSRSRRRP